MKTHNRGLHRFDRRAKLVVERRALRALDRLVRVKAEFPIIRRELIAPRRFARVVRARRRVREKIQVERPVRDGADLVRLFGNFFRRKHRAWQRPESARLGDGGHELPILRAGHRRLHDGNFNAEKFD
jgi:hypothetical protein